MFPLPKHNETYSFAKRNSGHLIEFFMNFSDFITVRNEVAKVMFLQVCVCPQGGLLWGGTWSHGGGFWSGGWCLVLGGSAPGGWYPSMD